MNNIMKISIYTFLSMLVSFLFINNIDAATTNKVIIFADKNITCDIYETQYGKNRLTYINPDYQNDAPLLDDKNGYYKTKLSGVVGWIKKDSSCIHSIKNVSDIAKFSFKTGGVTLSGLDVSRYQVINNKLYFALVHSAGVSHLTTKKLGYTNVPKGLYNKKVYYSYDGVYYYSSYNTMINDYKNNTYKNAANYKYPYYDYYQYLPLRSRTRLTSSNFNSYLISKKSDANDMISKSKTFKNCGAGKTTLTYKGTRSIIYNKGSLYFKNPNEKLNSSILYAITLNESAYGTSNYAIFYKNAFGWNAYDSCPNAAKKAKSIDEAVSKYFVNMSEGYANPANLRGGMGTHLGNKKAGANVKYASDPHWGYKAAQKYREMDRKYNYKDKNKYVVGIVNPQSSKMIDEIKLYNEPSIFSGRTKWYYDRNGVSLILLGESSGYYKVRNSTKPTALSVYIKKSDVKVINAITTYKEYRVYNKNKSLIKKTTDRYKYRLLDKTTVKKYSNKKIYVKYEYYYVNQKLISTDAKKAVRYKTLYKNGKAYVSYKAYYSNSGKLLASSKTTLRK